MTRLPIALSVLVLGATVLSAGATHVSAHAGLDTSNPADKQVLAAAPTMVTMTFKENLVPPPGSFIYVTTAGSSVAAGDSTVGATNTKLLTLPLKSGLTNGVYAVFWKSTSADDGGVTFGHLTFFVGTPAASDVANTPAGASIAVPDDATDASLSQAGTLTVKLPAGCSMVASTFADGTAPETMARAIAPATTVAMWKYDAVAGKYAGYSNAPGATNDLKAIDHLDAVWICVSIAANLIEPRA